MRTQPSLLLAITLVVATVLAIPWVPAVAQQDGEQGFYELEITWELLNDGKQLLIKDIKAEAYGDFILETEEKYKDKIEAKLIAESAIQFTIKDLALAVPEGTGPIWAVCFEAADGLDPEVRELGVQTLSFPSGPIAVFDVTALQGLPPAALEGSIRFNFCVNAGILKT